MITVSNGDISTVNPYSRSDKIWKTFITDDHANIWMAVDDNRQYIENEHNAMINTGMVLYAMANLENPKDIYFLGKGT